MSKPGPIPGDLTAAAGDSAGLPDLTDRVAVVTGGASGIGRGIARRLVEAGVRVVISDLDEDKAKATAGEIGAQAIAADVSDAQQVQALADGVLALHGKVDILVNNAGVGPHARVADLTLQDWRWMIDVNMFGVLHGLQSFLPLLSANPRGGYVVNTASMAGISTIPGVNMAAYTAAKMGVVGVTEILAKEMALDGVSVGVSLLLPGPVSSGIGASLRARPAGQGGALADVDLEHDGALAALRWMDPLDVGTLVVDGIRDGKLYIITHPELWPSVEARFDAIARAFGVTSP